jgi:lipid A disaccharide synthetase
MLTSINVEILGDVLHELGVFRSLASTKEIAMGFFNVKLLLFKQIEVFQSFVQNMNKNFQILVFNIQKIVYMTRVITKLKHCHLGTKNLDIS